MVMGEEYCVHAPPLSWYIVFMTPEVASEPASVMTTLERYQPLLPRTAPEPTLLVVEGATVSTPKLALAGVDERPALSVAVTVHVCEPSELALVEHETATLSSLHTGEPLATPEVASEAEPVRLTEPRHHVPK